MDLLPTGSNCDELIYIETDKLNFTIKGKGVHPRLEASVSTEKLSAIRVNCQEKFSFDDKGIRRKDKFISHTQNDFCLGSFKIMPMFYEYQNYEIIIESKNIDIIEFWHDNQHIRNKVSPVGRSGKIISGIINFGNEIGLSNLDVKMNNKHYLGITIEVFPTKIKYQEDYLALMADVTDEVYNLAFDFMKKTYMNASLNHKAGSSLTEFFSIIRVIYDQFINSADIILCRPHHVLQTKQEIVPAHKIKRVTSKTIRWIERHPEQLLRVNDQYNAGKALSIKKKVSYDTIENRFIKHILQTTIKKLGSLKNNYIKLNRLTDAEKIKEIDLMISGLNRRANFSFLSVVGAFESTASMSLVFSLAPGYKELYKCYFMLLHGLSFGGDVFNISVKDLAVLYEYWCFLKLNSLMKERYRLVKQDIIKVDTRGLFVTLRKGGSSMVTYANPYNGERIELSYNPQTNKLPTVAQKPDNVLSLQKKGAGNQYKYVFDAKYKINPALSDSSYASAYQTPGPEEEDINTMHRYRDAMVYNNGHNVNYERSMFGAYVLFPYGEEEKYRNHKFFKSISEVNIGGLPFLPSATTLVSDMLEELISDSPESAFERATLPVGITEKLKGYDFCVRDVLVGALRNREQLEKCREYNFYYIPANKIADGRFPLHYVALYQSDNLFGSSESGIKVYGEVLRCSKVKRSAIKEVPNTKHYNEWYYRFDVREWIKLDQPIKVKEYGPRVNVFTNPFLLFNSEFVPELYIQTQEEFRLYHELKRFSAQVEISGNESQVRGFEFNGARIIFREDEIDVFSQDGRYNRISKLEFLEKPRRTFNEIRRFLLEGG